MIGIWSIPSFARGSGTALPLAAVALNLSGVLEYARSQSSQSMAERWSVLQVVGIAFRGWVMHLAKRTRKNDEIVVE